MIVDKQKLEKAYKRTYKKDIPNRLLTVIEALANSQSQILQDLDQQEKNDFIIIMSELAAVPIPFVQVIKEPNDSTAEMTELSVISIPLSDVNQEVHDLLNQIKNIIGSNFYEELDIRQQNFLKLKQCLEKLSEYDEQIIGEEFKKIVIILYDVTRKYKAEDLTEKQYQILINICEKVVSNDFDKGDFIKVHRQLLDVELNWITGD